MHPVSDEGRVGGIEVVDVEADRRRREVGPSGLSFITSSGTSSNANAWSANPTCAIVKLPASDRRFSTMPTCSTQNLRQASASFT
jgi:hypothetical protein